jgi:hypothetical protein
VVRKDAAVHLIVKIVRLLSVAGAREMQSADVAQATKLAKVEVVPSLANADQHVLANQIVIVADVEAQRTALGQLRIPTLIRIVEHIQSLVVAKLPAWGRSQIHDAE